MSKCVEWTKSCYPYGYGRAWDRWAKKVVGAHRLTWQECFGPIPDGMLVCHHCDNPPCVNPEHLFLGTHKDNMRDKERKGRGGERVLYGEKNGMAKMTESMVREMRSSYQEGISTRVLARRFGIKQNAVWMIVTRQTWKQVTP